LEELEVEGLRGFWQSRRSYVKAVDGVTFKVYKNEIVGIVGESGCGKSTLAKLLIGLVEPPLQYIDGKVLIEGIDLYKLPEKKRRRINGEVISYVPQGAMNALNPIKRIIDLIIDIVKEHNNKYPKEQIYKDATKNFEEVGLSSDVLNMYPFELSGGMKQRAVIGISVMLNPKILVVDEPTSALDVSSQKVILKLLWKLKEERGMSMVFITHDIATVRQISSRIIVMYAGKIVEIGKTEDVIYNPLHPYTKMLMSAVVSLETEIRKRKIEGIPGAPPDLSNPPTGCRFAPRCPYVTSMCEKEPLLIDVGSDKKVACWRVIK
jgi:peptide/nickel transport system ATP-binding protein